MKLATTLLVLAMVNAAWAQVGVDDRTALERAGLVGPVAHVLTEEEGEDFARRVVAETRYDETGGVMEFVTYAYDFRDGSLRSRSVTAYEAGLRLVREAFDADGAVLATVVFRYDDRDRLVEEVAYDGAGGVTGREVHAYDDAGRLVRHESYRGASLHRVRDLDYAPDGRLRTIETFDGDGARLDVSSYADDGLSYEVIEFDAAGAVERRSAVRLDERGNVVEASTLDEDGVVVERTTFTYDDRGLLLEDRFETDLTSRPFEFVTEYAYTFDARGNWTVRETIEFGDVLQTRFRTITYR